jgi:hypothetical protein
VRARTFIGWRPLTYRSTGLAVGLGASYHIELEAPEDGEFSYVEFVHRDVRSRRDPDSGRLKREVITRPVSVDVTLPAGRVHLQDRPTDRGTTGEVFFGIRARRNGMLRALLGAGVISALVTQVIRLRLRQFGSHSGDSDAVAALLATFPALLATYVLQPGEHAIVARILRGPRLLLLISGSSAFAGALSLFAGYRYSRLSVIWSIIVIVNWTMVAGLAASYVLPRPAGKAR